jgi:hypothetical protein
MKIFIVVFAFAMLPHTSFAGEWVLWQSGPNPPSPITEHKTLKVCQVASSQGADATFAWAKNNESVKTETVQRSTNPDGTIYTYKKGLHVEAEFRCYPYGVVPTQGQVQSSASQ